jgi:hypothetical protein
MTTYANTSNSCLLRAASKELRNARIASGLVSHGRLGYAETSTRGRGAEGSTAGAVADVLPTPHWRFLPSPRPDVDMPMRRRSSLPWAKVGDSGVSTPGTRDFGRRPGHPPKNSETRQRLLQEMLRKVAGGNGKMYR